MLKENVEDEKSKKDFSVHCKGGSSLDIKIDV